MKHASSNGAFEKPIMGLWSFSGSCKRERADEPPLAHARGHIPTTPERIPAYRPRGK
jgi:hypothetical protein